VGCTLWCQPAKLTIMVQFSTIYKKWLVIRQRQQRGRNNPDQTTPKIWHYWTPRQLAFFKSLWAGVLCRLGRAAPGGAPGHL
jgi:hypothetical protein